MEALPSQLESLVPPPSGIATFTNNERAFWMDEPLRESKRLAVAEIAAEQLADANALVRMDAGTEAGSFIRTLGRRAFRRPLTEAEVEECLLLFETGASLEGDQTDFEKGASVVIEALLNSQNFNYRIESAAPGERLSGYEIIAKLSLWLTDTTPSDALLDRAAAGEFDTQDGVTAVANELLTDPRASEMVVDIFSQLYLFSHLENLAKSDPVYTEALNPELLESSELFFQYIYENDFGIREILTSTHGYVGPLMAPFYEITPAPTELTLLDLGPERAGYFSQVPNLMLRGDGSHSDPIRRGGVLLLRVLCAEMPSDPIDLEAPLPPAPDLTDRQRVDATTGEGTCGQGCHSGYINPLGFAFENFDGLGRLRDLDAGQPVDTRAAYPLEIGNGFSVVFDGAPELMSLMIESREVHACLGKNVAEYALQRDIVSSDQPLIDELADLSQAEGASLREMFLALIQTPAFHSRPVVDPDL